MYVSQILIYVSTLEGDYCLTVSKTQNNKTEIRIRIYILLLHCIYISINNIKKGLGNRNTIQFYYALGKKFVYVYFPMNSYETYN